MSPPSTLLHAAILSGVQTDLLITRYSDKLFISLTQLGKLGTILLVEKEAVKTGDARTEDGRLVFSSQVLLTVVEVWPSCIHRCVRLCLRVCAQGAAADVQL